MSSPAAGMASATSSGPRAEPPMPMTRAAEFVRAGRRYFAVQNVPSKGFDVRQGTINGRLQFRRGSQGGVAQPVVPHHAFFIRIGNGAGFQRLHVGKRLVYPPLHGRQERVVQWKFGKIKGDAQFRVANELLCV
ncbi:MAG: hypothetical protein ACLT8C_09200 [Akkermansia muciniphila]